MITSKKTMQITEEAYKALKARKPANETFSDVILRVIKEYKEGFDKASPDDVKKIWKM